MKKTIVILFYTLTAFCWAQEDVISKIEFTGVKRCNVIFLNKLLTVKEASAVDTILIQKDIKKLKRQVAIANATFRLDKISGNNYKLVYEIEENFTLIPQANIWTVDGKFSYNVGLYEYNLFGRNIKIGGFYQNNGFDSYGATFSAPYLFSKKWGLGINYQNWTNEEPLYFNELVANYKYNNEFIEVMAMFEISGKNNIGLGVNFFTEKYNYLNGDNNIDKSKVPLSLEQDKSMIKLVYTYDDLKYDYYLLSGFKSVLNLQGVVTENDFNNAFLIGFNDFLYFKRVGLKGNFATRLRLGIATNVNSPFAPFAVDNNLNIRGVGNTIDRGSASAVWNLEYRHTIIEKNWFVLQTNFFMDAGSWRSPGGHLSDILDSENFRIYAGGGLRFMHKKIYNAIFRIDYGYGITEEINTGGIVIGIGQYF